MPWRAARGFVVRDLPKRQRTGALQDASRGSIAAEERASVLDCGGTPPLFPKKPEIPAGRQISPKSLILNPYEPFQPIFDGLKTAVERFDGYQKLILGGIERLDLT